MSARRRLIGTALITSVVVSGCATDGLASLPLPAPGSQEKRAPVPWDAAEPYRGLGFREVHTAAGGSAFGLQEFPVQRS